MRIVMLNNGLANQVFQYIFGRGLEITLNEKVIYDDSYFWNDRGLKHANGTSAQRYQLKEVFDLDLNLLSNQIEEKRWNQYIEILRSLRGEMYNYMPELLRINYPDLRLIAESGDFKFGGPKLFTAYCLYDPRVYTQNSNTYYHGYWINKVWFNKNKEMLLKELKFKEIDESHNLIYAKQIQETNSVAIHLRKFSKEGFEWEMPNEYYRNKIKELNEILNNPYYFIFSDEVKWCKKDYKELGFDLIGNRVVFIEGNEATGMNYRDLQLMSMCKHMILCNSSFSYLAALLNQNENKLIINPTQRDI